MEKQEAAVQRLKELVEAPPGRLDQLLEKMGREPTLENHLKEIGKLVLRAHENLLQALRAMKNKNGD